jgi:hypothetical protein
MNDTEKTSQGSLRARKNALSKRLNIHDQETLLDDRDDYKDIIREQLEIIKKQAQQIDSLIGVLSNGDGVQSPKRRTQEDNYVIEDEPDVPLFIDELIKTDGIEASGSLDSQVIAGNSIDGKLKKLRELRGK